MPPVREPNTAAKTRGIDRIDSLTVVTSRTARARHPTGQCPPTGHGGAARVGRAPGSESVDALGGAAADRTGPGNGGAAVGTS